MIRHLNNPEPAMRSDATGSSNCARGIVQVVDTVQRELTVLLKDGLEVFDIPPDCPIFLNGERIKLRLIQPRDQVKVSFAKSDALRTATSVEVQPNMGFCCARL